MPSALCRTLQTSVEPGRTSKSSPSGDPNSAIGALEIDPRTAAVEPSLESPARDLAHGCDTDAVSIDAAVCDPRGNGCLRSRREPQPYTAVGAAHFVTGVRNAREIGL